MMEVHISDTMIVHRYTVVVSLQTEANLGNTMSIYNILWWYYWETMRPSLEGLIISQWYQVGCTWLVVEKCNDIIVVHKYIIMIPLKNELFDKWMREENLSANTKACSYTVMVSYMIWGVLWNYPQWVCYTWMVVGKLNDTVVVYEYMLWYH